jgi:hypothetical protein
VDLFDDHDNLLILNAIVMKSIGISFFIVFIVAILMVACKHKEKSAEMNIIFLHHSTGAVIWNGSKTSFARKAAWKVSSRLAEKIKTKPRLPRLFKEYNKENNTNYIIRDMIFPKSSPYGWNNYPFDYYNIWVKHAGEHSFLEEPTLEMLTKENQVIIFKHCFPVCNIQTDQDSSDINSDVKTISNYRLQYEALREKLHEFPDTKFILFTGAAQVKSTLKEEEAKRAKEFFEWVKNDWDMPQDNIYLWDLYNLETEGELYLKNEFARSPEDSHPNEYFATKAVQLMFNRIIDIIEKEGNGTNLKGEIK